MKDMKKVTMMNTTSRQIKQLRVVGDKAFLWLV